MGTVRGGTETSCEVPMKAEGGESESPLTIGMTGEVKMSFHRPREAHDDDGDHKQHELLKGFKKIRKVRGSTAKERISRMPPCTAGKRSSIYRGVTRHRWTGRYEAHLWDKSSWNQDQNKKGKQVYLGAYDYEEAAARAYDLAALKYWGPGTLINFPISDYARDVEEMQKVSREEYLASLRRKSSSCSRASSKFRGMNRASSSGQWELNLGQMLDNTYFNSGICSTSAEAATACEYGGNFNLGRRIDLTNYIKWWKPSKGVPTSTDKGQITLGIGLANQQTEPYQLPTLGVSFKGKAQTVVTACELLSQSAAFRFMKEKVKASEDVVPSSYDMTDKKLSLIEKSKMPLETSVVNTPSLQMNPYSVFSLTSSQIMGECSSLDPLADSILWSSILPPTGLSITNTHQQSDPNSGCTFYGQD